MLRTILKIGSGAAGLLLLVGMTGCAAQPETTPLAMSPTQGDAVGTALVNQGRFPAPIYSQEEQPAYALTGNTQESWPQTTGYYQVGNDRIILPATP